MNFHTRDINDMPYNSNTSQRVSFVGAFKSFWVNYGDFKDYSSRTEYWYWQIWNCIFLLPLIIYHYSSISGSIPKLIAIIYFLVLLIPNLALISRRMHDTGISAPLRTFLITTQILFSGIPVLNLICWSLMGIIIFVITLLPTNHLNY